MTSGQVVVLLLDLAIILVLSHSLGAVATLLGQPAVIGEIIAGVLVGPTLFGGAIANSLFPADVRPLLSALANVGLALFMFIVGLDLDQSLVRGKGKATVTVALTSTLLPFGLGVVLALHLVSRHPSSNHLGFALFIGAAMSVTAFPVLARILTDRGMNHTRLGVLAMGSAAIADIFAWSLLAVVVMLVGKNGQQYWRILLVVPFFALMFLVVRPLLLRLADTRKRVSGVARGPLAIVLSGVLVSAALTEWIGLHFIFGAFLFGFLMPRGDVGDLRGAIRNRVEHVSALLLLPVYFVIAGLQVDLSRASRADFGELGLIMAVAIAGKFVGTFIGAWLHGVEARQMTALGTLMNTRGLTELVIVTVGLQLGVVDHGLYSQMVVMAVVTTAMTGILLQLIYPRRLVQRDVEQEFSVGAVHGKSPKIAP
jgi:Kef-type K+ transport system membrane component KefB